MIIDALLLGRPVVAIKGTWLGRVAETTGAGLACDPNPDSIVSAVRKVVSEFDTFSTAAARARRDYFRSNSWQALFSSVLGGDGARLVSDSDTTHETDIFGGADAAKNVNTVDEIDATHAAKPPDFRRANELFRHGAYEQALKMYLALNARHHLDIYEFNASLTARRLGFGSVREAMHGLEKSD